jgi:hypothetical protein
LGNQKLAATGEGAELSVSTVTQAVKPPVKPIPAGAPLMPLAAAWPTATLPEKAMVVAEAPKPTASKAVSVSVALPETDAKQGSLGGGFNDTAAPLATSEQQVKANFIICPVCNNWFKPNEFGNHVLSRHPSHAKADWLADSIVETHFSTSRGRVARRKIKTKKTKRMSLHKTTTGVARRKPKRNDTSRGRVARQRIKTKNAKRRSLQKAPSGVARRKPKRKTSRPLFHPGWSYDEFERRNRKMGRRVSKDDFHWLQISWNFKPGYVKTYSKAHGPLTGDIHKAKLRPWWF